jgi:hypothetical protein
MSLTRAERERTGEELRANHRLAGLSDDDVCADLGFTAQQLDDTLHVRRTSRPEDVWLLRDYLEQELRASGKEPVPYSVLTETARAAARV